MNYKRLITIMAVTGVVAIILGSTFAYWRWQSTNAQKTNVTFTTGANFSCSADGGGSITNRGYFAPTSCTNSTYAIQRTITTNVTNNSDEDLVALSMWLNVDEIDEWLGYSENFKYALTTSPSSCTTGVITEGNFYGVESGDTISLLDGEEFAKTKTKTYYLYIWLDAAETDEGTQYNYVDISLGGTCTNIDPNYVYALDLLGGSDNNRYQTPGAAMAALKAAGDGVTDYPVYLRYRVVPVWFDDYNNVYYTENECLQAPHDYDNCPSSTYIIESYVGFVVTPTMAANNTGMTAGTYYLRNGYDEDANDPDHAPSLYYEDNVETLQTAFGSSHCQELSGYAYDCGVTGLSASVLYSGGRVNASDGNASCGTDSGSGHCGVLAP